MQKSHLGLGAILDLAAFLKGTLLYQLGIDKCRIILVVLVFVEKTAIYLCPLMGIPGFQQVSFQAGDALLLLIFEQLPVVYGLIQLLENRFNHLVLL